jgi:hemerythrin
VSFFPWKPEYSVQNAEIDDQHKKLVDLLNTLYTAMQAGQGRQIVGEAINALAAYTQTHFSFEERLLQANKYPDFYVHKKEHENFIAKVKEFQAMYQSGSPSIAIQISNFGKTWLIEHIMQTDQKYAGYLNGKTGRA